MANLYSACVIGVGELGQRIAGELSLCGVKVNVFDKDSKRVKNINYQITQQKEELIRNELITHDHSYGDVSTFSNLPDALCGVDFVFEAIVDNLEIKQWLYEKVTINCKSDTIVCSNTLQLQMEDIAENALFKNRVIGCRFLMPVYCIPMVEVTYTTLTTIDVIRKVTSFFNAIRKRVIVRQADENPKLLTLQETRYFWKVAKECNDVDQINQNSTSTISSELEYTYDSSKIPNDDESCFERNSNTDQCPGYTHENSKTSKEEEYKLCKCGQQNSSCSVEHSLDTLDNLVTESNLELCKGNHGNAKHHGQGGFSNEISASNSQGDDDDDATVNVINSSTIPVPAPQLQDTNTPDSVFVDGEQRDELKPRLASRNSSQSSDTVDGMPSECVLCNDARINCVLDPCGHMWLCFECGKTVQKSGKGCPACRNPIHKIIRVFLP